MRLLWLALALCASASAQIQWYPFGIDQDALSGAPDFSFLNHPLDRSDRIFVRDGHFYRVGPDELPNTEDDSRVRLFGVNLAFGANFPVEADATRIAARLAKLGVNLVRLHHMDSQPDRDPNTANSLLTQAPYPTLNPVSVKRLRTFLDALKAAGIYCNLNLHVGYTFRPAVDGVPALPAGMSMPTQSKPLHMIHPKMMELQAQYARRVIDALGLADDPVLAMVEINNESSVVYAWQSGQLDPNLAGEYEWELSTAWNAWLAGRYETTLRLRDAWGPTTEDGPSILPNKWSLEVHSPSQASMSGPDASGEMTVKVAQGGAAVIAKQVGFSLSTDQVYVAQVDIRAELAGTESRNVYLDVKQDVSPWNTLTSKSVAVTSEWQTVKLSFQPSFAMNGIGRLGLSVEASVGAPVHIRNARLSVAGRRGLSDGEVVEAGTVALVHDTEAGTVERTNDYLRFLADRDYAYLDAMLAAVREKVGPLVPVAGTQVGFGGFLNYDSHAAVDYQDNHFYVDHYSFPNTPWDGRDWTIADSSSLGSGLTNLSRMAITRQAGRPYTVSEFNQPWPNRQAAECDPVLAAFGAFQDWDAIVHFAYSHGRNWDDGVPNGFNINGDWTKFAGFGQSAFLFRTGITSGSDALDVPVSSAARLEATRQRRNGSVPEYLSASAGYAPAISFTRPVRLTLSEDARMPADAQVPPAPPYRSSTGEFTYDPQSKMFLIHSATAAGVIGYSGGRPWTAGPLDVEVASTARGYVALLATALDGKPLADSDRILLSHPGASLRSQPKTAPPREQRLVNYPGSTTRWTLEPDQSHKPSGDLNGGQAPTWMERIETWVTLRSNAGGLTVYPLDGAGKRQSPLNENEVMKTEQGFRIHLHNSATTCSIWYEIVTSVRLSRPARRQVAVPQGHRSTSSFFDFNFHLQFCPPSALLEAVPDNEVCMSAASSWPN